MIKMEDHKTAQNDYRRISKAVDAAKAGAAVLGVVLMAGGALWKKLPKKGK